MTAQPRQPKGTNVGGQYATSPHAETQGALTDTDTITTEMAWSQQGFTADEAEQWIQAGCTDPRVAQRAREHWVDPGPPREPYALFVPGAEYFDWHHVTDDMIVIDRFPVGLPDSHAVRVDDGSWRVLRGFDRLDPDEARFDGRFIPGDEPMDLHGAVERLRSDHAHACAWAAEVSVNDARQALGEFVADTGYPDSHFATTGEVTPAEIAAWDRRLAGGPDGPAGAAVRTMKAEAIRRGIPFDSHEVRLWMRAGLDDDFSGADLDAAVDRAWAEYSIAGRPYGEWWAEHRSTASA